MQVKDKVGESSSSTGTGNFTVSGALTGHRTFNAAFGTGVLFPYQIDDGAGNWETGVGQLTAATTLARTRVHSNSLGTTALINFGAGTKEVRSGPTAAFSIAMDPAATVAAPQAATDSLAIGAGALANVADAVAVGEGALVNGNGGTALGRGASAAAAGTALGSNASAGSGIALGAQATASGGGIAIGQATATHALSMVGQGVTSRMIGQRGFSAAQVSNAAVAERIDVELAAASTSATPVELTANFDGTNNGKLALNASESWHYRITVIARKQGTGETWCKRYELVGKVVGGVAAQLGSTTETSVQVDAALSGATFAATIDTANNKLKLVATGLAATTIRWVAHVEASGIRYDG